MGKNNQKQKVSYVERHRTSMSYGAIHKFVVARKNKSSVFIDPKVEAVSSLKEA